MEFVPGEPERRPAWVTASAERTAVIREAEHDIQLHSLIGVQLDTGALLSEEQVHREALRQLAIPGHQLGVSVLKEATFLLRFVQPAQRNAALGRGLLMVGRTRIHLMPWTRQFGVTATSKFSYRVRACIEGIPAHAVNTETISKLFPPTTLVDRIDTEKNSAKEKACVCVWVTLADPDSIAVERTLKLEEPVEFTEEQHNDFSTRPGNMELPEVRPGAAALLDYEVIIHVDQVLDFNSPAGFPSRRSFESDTSGIPDDSVEEEWPIRHCFPWQLGVPDRLRPPRRVPVHDRLGARRRDRSPPGGGNGGRGGM